MEIIKYFLLILLNTANTFGDAQIAFGKKLEALLNFQNDPSSATSSSFSEGLPIEGASASVPDSMDTIFRFFGAPAKADVLGWFKDIPKTIKKEMPKTFENIPKTFENIPKTFENIPKTFDKVKNTFSFQSKTAKPTKPKQPEKSKPTANPQIKPITPEKKGIQFPPKTQTTGNVISTPKPPASTSTESQLSTTISTTSQINESGMEKNVTIPTKEVNILDAISTLVNLTAEDAVVVEEPIVENESETTLAPTIHDDTLNVTNSYSNHSSISNEPQVELQNINESNAAINSTVKLCREGEEDEAELTDCVPKNDFYDEIGENNSTADTDVPPVNFYDTEVLFDGENMSANTESELIFSNEQDGNVDNSALFFTSTFSTALLQSEEESTITIRLLDNNASDDSSFGDDLETKHETPRPVETENFYLFLSTTTNLPLDPDINIYTESGTLVDKTTEQDINLNELQNIVDSLANITLDESTSGVATLDNVTKNDDNNMSTNNAMGKDEYIRKVTISPVSGREDGQVVVEVPNTNLPNITANTGDITTNDHKEVLQNNTANLKKSSKARIQGGFIFGALSYPIGDSEAKPKKAKSAKGSLVNGKTNLGNNIKTSGLLEVVLKTASEMYSNADNSLQADYPKIFVNQIKQVLMNLIAPDETADCSVVDEIVDIISQRENTSAQKQQQDIVYALVNALSRCKRQTIEKIAYFISKAVELWKKE